MNGNGIGVLRVWVWAQNGAQTPIWELKGRQGASWLQGRVQIPAQTMQYKVIIKQLLNSHKSNHKQIYNKYLIQ